MDVYTYIANCEVNAVRLAVDKTQKLYLQPSSYPSYYFVKGELHRGRVTVCDGNGGYRPLIVCDDSWTHSDAAVVCRELGFSAFGEPGSCMYCQLCVMYILQALISPHTILKEIAHTCMQVCK